MTINKKSENKMKRIIPIIFASIVVLAFSSCHTTEKFYINGPAGTEIYNPVRQKIATIQSDGRTKIALSSDICYSYMLAKNPGSDLYVPFALDYKNKSYLGSRTLAWTSGVVSIAGSVTCTILALTAGEEDCPEVGYAGAAALIGAFGGLSASMRANQTSHEWNYTYLKQQHTNNDLPFTLPVYTEPIKQRALSGSLSEQEDIEAAGWTQTTTKKQTKKQTKRQTQTPRLPFRNKTYDVVQVVSHFNGNSIKMEPKGTVTVKNNTITINIKSNSYLSNKSIHITKDLKKNITFGDPQRDYALYENSVGEEIGLYYDSIEELELYEEKILIRINESIAFEIAFM